MAVRINTANPKKIGITLVWRTYGFILKNNLSAKISLKGKLEVLGGVKRFII
jgi:hypothetical protein